MWFSVSGIEPRATNVLGKRSTRKLHFLTPLPVFLFPLRVAHQVAKVKFELTS